MTFEIGNKVNNNQHLCGSKFSFVSSPMIHNMRNTSHNPSETMPHQNEYYSHTHSVFYFPVNPHDNDTRPSTEHVN